MTKDTLTGTGPVVITDVIPGELIVVGCGGDADDFTWQVQFSLDDGATWHSYKQSGSADITGDDVRDVRAISKNLRVNVSALGTATSIDVQGGAAEGGN